MKFKRLLDPDDAAWRALMAVYTAAFEEPQRETEEGLRSNLITPQAPREGGHMVIAAMAAETTCLGGTIFSYLPAIDCGYASYVFVAERSRRHGIGGRLLNATRARLEAEAAQCGRPPLLGLFTEIQREREVDDRAHATLRFWARHGVLPLAVGWQYPPLHNGDTPVPTYLAFGPYGEAPVAWYPRDLEHVASAIFGATYSYLPEAPPTLASVIDGLRHLPQEQPVALVKPV